MFLRLAKCFPVPPRPGDRINNANNSTWRRSLVGGMSGGGRMGWDGMGKKNERHVKKKIRGRRKRKRKLDAER